MKKYEIMTITKGTKGDDVAKKFSEELSKLVVALGGNILESDLWGNRKLSYKIREEKEGYYQVAIFELESSKLNDLKSQLNLNENLVRYLITAQS